MKTATFPAEEWDGLLQWRNQCIDIEALNLEQFLERLQEITTFLRDELAEVLKGERKSSTLRDLENHDIYEERVLIDSRLRDIETASQDKTEAEKHFNWLKGLMYIIRNFIESLYLFVETNKAEQAKEAVSVDLNIVDFLKKLEAFWTKLQLCKDFKIDEKLQGRTMRIVEGDIFTLLHNVLKNAIKHGKRDGIRVNVEAKLENNQVVIAVLDNGEGIDESKFPNGADDMFSINTGKGLRDLEKRGFIGIAEAHGGLDNNKGSKGARIEIKLPLAR